MNSKRCYSGSVVIGRVFSQMKVMRELRETSVEILGSLMNGKSRPKPGSNSNEFDGTLKTVHQSTINIYLYSPLQHLR